MCAIFGIAGHEEASHLVYLGLHALQHRGQEGAGIVSTENNETHVYRGEGLVNKVFNRTNLETLKGKSAIGHTRYSTTGPSNAANLQPLLMTSRYGWMAIAHNGNLVNAGEITENLEKEGSIFQSTNDTEVIFHLAARSNEADPLSALVHALKRVEGAFSLLVLTEDKLIAVRDCHGFRPLVMGEIHGKTVFASETTAFDLIGATYVRAVKPGEVVVTSLETGKVLSSSFPFEPKEKKRCIFEFVYFARPDSQLFGDSVHGIRRELGAQLAREKPVPGADVVIPVPDSGVPAALGFAEEAGIRFDMGIIRSHYVGRTFIEPQQSIRNFGVKLKLNPVRSALQDKKVVVIDDSLVRGTTSKKLIHHLREAGAKEIHLRISSPPITDSCFYGIDTPTKSELIASQESIDSIREFIGADSLGYLSLDGLLKVGSRKAGPGFCHACFSGEYPTPLPTKL